MSCIGWVIHLLDPFLISILAILIFLMILKLRRDFVGKWGQPTCLNTKKGMAVHVCSPNTQEAEAGGL